MVVQRNLEGSCQLVRVLFCGLAITGISLESQHVFTTDDADSAVQASPYML